MNTCNLCARHCGADRAKHAGTCGSDSTVRVARAALHMWEEPCISGKEGSGAVFFTGCPLHCVFCQNYGIANGGGKGIEVSVAELAGIFLRLQNIEHANNINLVTPTQFVPQIAEAVKIAKEGCPESVSAVEMAEKGGNSGYASETREHERTEDGNGSRGAFAIWTDKVTKGKAEDGSGLHIPVVYNTASVETPETVEMLDGTVDIFLPDFKYCDPEIAGRYSRMPEYFDTAAKAVEKMVELSGPPEFDARGMMTRGTIVRHLILPGHTKDSEKILQYLHGMYGDDIYISIMNQYTPMPGIGKKYPELARKITKREYEKVVDYALSIGITNAFIQEGGTQKDSFIPEFDGIGVI